MKLCFPAELQNDRVDEHKQVVSGRRYVDGHDATMDIDLSSREPYAAGRVHRFSHVADQLAYLAIDRPDRFRNDVQSLVGVLQDRKDRHGVLALRKKASLVNHFLDGMKSKALDWLM